MVGMQTSNNASGSICLPSLEDVHLAAGKLLTPALSMSFVQEPQQVVSFSSSQLG